MATDWEKEFTKLTSNQKAKARTLLLNKADKISANEIRDLKKSVSASVEVFQPRVQLLSSLLRRVELLRILLFEESSRLTQSEQNLVASALAYFVERHDLIEDLHSYEGILDDAFVISVALEQLMEKAEAVLMERQLRLDEYL